MKTGDLWNWTDEEVKEHVASAAPAFEPQSITRTSGLWVSVQGREAQAPAAYKLFSDGRVRKTEGQRESLSKGDPTMRLEYDILKALGRLS